MNRNSLETFKQSLDEAIYGDIEDVAQHRFSFLNGFVSCLYLERLIDHESEIALRNKINEARRTRALLMMDGSITRLEARINDAVNPIYP